MYNEVYDPTAQSQSTKNEIYEWVEAAVLSMVCVILIFTFVGRLLSVSGESMMPTLQDGDRLISSRMLYTPTYGDIVVITQPNSRNEPLIKRIVATENQTIDIDFQQGIVTIDGKVMEEEYILEPTHVSFDMEFPVTVPEGHVFVMGDNRNDSWDSRDTEVGMVDERYILGRVVYRLTPFDERGNPDKNYNF